MTDALAAAITRCWIDATVTQMFGDADLERRLGFSIARRHGLVCVASTKVPRAVFTRAMGYGTLVEASQRAIDAVLRHYGALGLPARFEVLVPAVGAAALELLARNGFRREEFQHFVHVRSGRRSPRAHQVKGLRIERVAPKDAQRYARLATRGFGGSRSLIAMVFERGWARQLATRGDRVAVVGYVNGRPAATGVLLIRRPVAGLYSGSVLPRFRGRGIQNAMIAERVRIGLTLGVSDFFSATDEIAASARNLRDEGFRTRFEFRRYTRGTD